MGFKRFIVKILAKKNEKSIHISSNNAIKNQLRLFKYLTSVLHKTEYGRGFGVPKNISISSFQKKIPIVNYEKIKPFINKVALGEKNVLWKGLPKYFAKTSGTTSGIKYIPLSKEMLKIQIRSTKEALLLYAQKTKKFDIIDGKMMFIQGSPIVSHYKKIDFLVWQQTLLRIGR